MHNIILAFCLIMVVGCVPQTPAPIEFNHDKTFDNKNIDYEEKSSATEHDSGDIVTKSLANEDNFEPPKGVLKEPHPQIQPIIIKEDDKRKIIYHEVAEGETIEQIAANYDQAVEEIAELNELLPPYQLQQFQIIKIKVNSETLNRKNQEHAENLTKSSSAPNQTKFIKPVNGIIITKFGQQTEKGKSNGIDIEAKAGSEIKSIADGVVVHAGTDAKFGNLVIIKLDKSDLYVAYAHMEELMIAKGQEIKQSEVIGHIGSSGEVTIPQLHLAIREGKLAVDPLKYIIWY